MIDLIIKIYWWFFWSVEDNTDKEIFEITIRRFVIACQTNDIEIAEEIISSEFDKETLSKKLPEVIRYCNIQTYEWFITTFDENLKSFDSDILFPEACISKNYDLAEHLLSKY